MEFSLEKAIQVLERTPAIFESLLSGISRDWSHCSEGPDSFSPFDVLGHLIDGEETDWIIRARLILESGPSRSFEPYDRFRHYQRNNGRSTEDLLDEFTSLRARNISVLRGWNLTESDLDRQGVHPEFGQVSLRQLLASWVVHDLGHIGQAVRVMAKQFDEEVGPWKAYLPVLQSGRRL